MAYDHHCNHCPYNRQEHLEPTQRTCRDDPPVELEDNGSRTLIVALAPGVEEWSAGMPLVPTVRVGGTGGRRVELSWERSGRHRSEFNIVEAVQCYPGNGGPNQRDYRPKKEAVRACQGRLRDILMESKYERAVALGVVAYDSLDCIVRNTEGLDIECVEGPHPNGRATLGQLDEVWG